MSGPLAYDPLAIERLRRETAWAIGALRGLSEDDPAAETARSAVVALHRVLADHWIPAIAAVQRHDPLSGGLTTRSLRSTGTAEPASLPTLLGWAHQHAVQLATMNDAELLAAFDRRIDELPLDAELLPDLDDPFWIEFEALASELAVRVATQRALAESVIEGVRSNPLLALAVGFATFPSGVVQSMTIEALQATSHIDDVESRYDALAVESLMRELLPHPELVLGVIVDFPALRELIHWPFVDADLAAEFVRTGMLHPVDEPDRLDDGLRVLEHFVALANERRFEQGFPPPFGKVMAAGVATYLPEYVDALAEGSTIDLGGPGTVTREEFVDLLGAVLYDPGAGDILVGAVRSMAVLSLIPGSEFNILHVGDFAQLMIDGAENERLEATIRASANRALLQDVLTVLGLVAGSIAATSSLSGASRALISQIVSGGGDAAIGRIEPDETGIDDPSRILAFVLDLTACEAFLADPHRHRDDKLPLDEARLQDAATSLTRIGELLAIGTSLEGLNDELRELERHIRAIGGDHYLRALQVGSIGRLKGADTEPDT